MKTPLEAPEKQIAAETGVKPAKSEGHSVIDTSKMSAGKAAALELAVRLLPLMGRVDAERARVLTHQQAPQLRNHRRFDPTHN